MFAMPGTSGKVESASQEDQGFPGYRYWVGGFVVLYIAFNLYLLWQDDEIRLSVMHSLIHFLQYSARLVGSCALALEQDYNEYVQLLH